jgi:hypothetical protein
MPIIASPSSAGTICAAHPRPRSGQQPGEHDGMHAHQEGDEPQHDGVVVAKAERISASAGVVRTALVGSR